MEIAPNQTRGKQRALRSEGLDALNRLMEIDAVGPAKSVSQMTEAMKKSLIALSNVEVRKEHNCNNY